MDIAGHVRRQEVADLVKLDHLLRESMSRAAMYANMLMGRGYDISITLGDGRGEPLKFEAKAGWFAKFDATAGILP